MNKLYAVADRVIIECLYVDMIQYVVNIIKFMQLPVINYYKYFLNARVEIKRKY